VSEKLFYVYQKDFDVDKILSKYSGIEDLVLPLCCYKSQPWSDDFDMQGKILSLNTAKSTYSVYASSRQQTHPGGSLALTA